MVCDAAGDPQQYSGRPMGDAHRHLGIAEEEWAAFVHDLHRPLSRFQVPPAEQSELVAIVESTKEAIVLVPALQSGPSPGSRGCQCRRGTRTRQPRHVGSPRRGSLGRRTQSEEG
jgi:hypothetical protein